MKVIGTKEVLSREEVNRILVRMAHQILEPHQDAGNLAIIGIRTGGAFLAEILRDELQRLCNVDIPLGLLDITLYRDDLSRIGYQPLMRKTEIPFNIDDRVVILVDDVLFTGRTVRAAMDAMMDLGRPSMIKLAVLVDRGHRELPISYDYVGRSQETDRSENIEVIFDDSGKPLNVVLQQLSE